MSENNTKTPVEYAVEDWGGGDVGITHLPTMHKFRISKTDILHVLGAVGKELRSTIAYDLMNSTDPRVMMRWLMLKLGESLAEENAEGVKISTTPLYQGKRYKLEMTVTINPTEQ